MAVSAISRKPIQRMNGRLREALKPIESGSSENNAGIREREFAKRKMVSFQNPNQAKSMQSKFKTGRFSRQLKRESGFSGWNSPVIELPKDRG
jgi:hypothetical protein